jgi:threo-3-hydroxy-L-aspartate ammonia-lyase
MSVTYADVEDAAARVEGVAHRTPVLTSTTLDERLGARFFLKCENLQRAGAFKFRGAYNAISRLDSDQRAAGVVAFSSGNHAQATALASRILGVSATIVMPSDAPKLKLAATRGYGAEVVIYDRMTEDREAIAGELSARDGRTVIAPFDNDHVIAGQGTATRELIEEVGDLDYLITPVGGGGLISGSSIAAKALCADITVYGIEPAVGNDVQLALHLGEHVRLDQVPDTIADGARTQEVGEITFPIIQENVSDIFLASDSEIIEAIIFLAERVKTFVEPTGALAVAGLEQIKDRLAGARVGVIISGGNMNISRLVELIGQRGEE